MFDINKFKALAPEYQQILELLSIIYLPIASTPLAQCASRAGIKNPQSQASWTNRSIKLALYKLAEDDWVHIENNVFSLPKELLNAISLHSLEDGNFHKLAQTIQDVFSPRHATSGKRIWSSWPAAVADARMYMYMGDYLTLKSVLADINSHFRAERKGNCYPFADIFGVKPRREELAALSDEVFISAVAPVYTSYAAFRLDNIDDFWAEMLERQSRVSNSNHAHVLQTLIAEQSLVRGDYRYFPQKPGHDFYAALWSNTLACKQLMQGEAAKAIDSYELSIRLLRVATKQRHDVYHRDIFEVFHFINLLTSGAPNALGKTQEAHQALGDSFTIYYLLLAYAELLDSGDDSELKEEITLLDYHEDAFTLLFMLLISYWSGLPAQQQWVDAAIDNYLRASNNGYRWFAAEFAEALYRHLPSTDERRKEYRTIARELHDSIGSKTLFNLVNRQHSWERSLDALNKLALTMSEESGEEPQNQRLVWIIEEENDVWDIVPRLQKLTKSGAWSKGRTLTLAKLVNERDEMPFLSREDIRIINHAITDTSSFNFYGGEYEVDMDKAWPELIEHPRVFWEKNRTTPVEITRGEIELLVTEEGDDIRVTIYPEVRKYHLQDTHYIIIKETPARLRIYRIGEQDLKVFNIIGDGILMPKEAEKQLRQTLITLAPQMRIQSDIAGMDNARLVESDPRIHVHLLPHGDGLRLSLRVQPFGEGKGPIYPPGHGRKNLLIENNGEKLKVQRGIEDEREQVEQLQQQVEILADWDDLEDEIVLEDPNEALEAITGLHGIEGGRVLLEWPEGEFLKVSSTLDARNMRLNVNGKGEWFELNGEVDVNDNLVLSLAQLLELSRGNNSRFLKLSDGQYVALTRSLQKKLQAVNAYAEQHDGETRLNSFATLALEDFLEEAALLEGDGKWRQHVDQLKQIQSKHHEAPATLQAELREYQQEGFRWMARLAEWGVGACLADDMGLGKTIQSLALILTRASQGPTLVVAPVSVCNNWFSEVQKFAPTLNPVFYRGKERLEILQNLKPYDLVICSYGLLPQDAEAITGIEWTTALLDEAQAIKNTGAKRTRAAWNIKAGFKLITTGTPIENHLGELWSLFRFLNPGLLGTQDHFVKVFMSPIERFKDKNASQNLKRLIQPFILRRLKSEVLNELPPRTEITYSVPLSDEERALYEAVRQKVVNKFVQAESAEADKNFTHVQVLAEITRLRLASCHPKLVMRNSPLEGSKLKAFGEILEELLENHHKALVFSQFVKHLAIIRDYLHERGIHYQYLDGSTSQAQRKKTVDDFQSGKGDVFLISLKAGGAGLNLTAADYVIHMDPWWNPAVEDQASDRAHRIGQLRPVTIYRLVAENTIEEKIVKLHERKRALADNLLEGSDMSGKMNVDEMLQLIKGS